MVCATSILVEMDVNLQHIGSVSAHFRNRRNQYHLRKSSHHGVRGIAIAVASSAAAVLPHGPHFRLGSSLCFVAESQMLNEIMQTCATVVGGIVAATCCLLPCIESVLVHERRQYAYAHEN